MVETARVQWKITEIGEKQRRVAKISTPCRKLMSLNPLSVRNGSPGTISVKFCTEVRGQRMARVDSSKKIAASFNPLTRVHERYRQIDDRQTDLR